MSASDEVRQPARPALPPALYALASAMLCAHVVMSSGGVGQAVSAVSHALASHAAVLAASVALLAVVATWTCLAPRAGGARARGAHARRGSLDPTGLAAGTTFQTDPVIRGSVAAVGVAGSCALLLVSLVASAVVAEARLSAGSALVTALESTPIDRWSFTVLGDPSLTARGYWRCRVRASAPGQASGDLWLVSTQSFEIGDVISVSAGFVANDDDEWGRINRSQGVWGRLMPKEGQIVGVEGPNGPFAHVRRLRDGARAIIDPYSSPSRALIAGCVIGDRRAMDHFGLDDTFSACGVSHLVAVSGGHIVILGQLLGLLLDRTRLRPRPRLAVLTLTSGVYVLLTGGVAPAVRSWVMAVVGHGAQLVGRRSDALSAVALVGLVMTLADPASASQIGFILSIVCVGGLCIFSGYVGYALRLVAGVGKRAPRRETLAFRLDRLRADACDTLAATLVAQVAAMPVSVPTFMQVSLVAPIANLLLSAPFTLLIAFGFVGSCLPLPSTLSHASLSTCDLCADIAIALLDAVGRIPFASIPADIDVLDSAAVIAAFGAVLLVVWPRLSRRAASVAFGAAIVAIGGYLLRWGLFAPARVVVLDIGQGDAILVQDGASAILVDTGPDETVRRALARNHVLRLDAVVITHLHADHYGGTDELVGFVAVDEIIVAEGAAAGAAEIEELREAAVALTDSPTFREVGYRDMLRVGGFGLKVVWPREPRPGDENADSLELALSYERAGLTLSAFLTGDAERDETGSVIAAGDVGDVDFLKVGHHGSAVSVSPEGAQALAAEIAVASAGEGNSYGHPTSECVDVLRRSGSLVLCTKDVGDVSVAPGRGGAVVSCQRGLPQLAAM